MGGCLSFVAFAVMSACGGGQSNPEPGTSVAFKADGSRMEVTFDPRSAETQAGELVRIGKAPPPRTTPPGKSASAPGRAPLPDDPAPSDPPPVPAPVPAPAPAPAPAPGTSTMTNTIPAIDKSKIPLGSPGTGVDQITPTTELPAPSDGAGQFRTACQFSHMAFDDPIVYPGQPGMSHLHVFFGNTGVNANSTAASIANTGNSTCLGGTINRTGYWVPAMIDTKDGTPVAPSIMGVYYKTGYAGVAAASVRAIPQGLRMIAGNSKATAPVQWGPTKYTCIDPVSGFGPQTYHIPTTCPAGSTIYATVIFPQCWDGVNLDSPDHKSHMAYPVGGCPSTHPVPIPEITINVLYGVKDPTATARWRLSSDNYDPSTPAGYSAHADWFNGWKPAAMDAFIKGCDQAARDCHAHLLGDGNRIF